MGQWRQRLAKAGVVVAVMVTLVACGGEGTNDGGSGGGNGTIDQGNQTIANPTASDTTNTSPTGTTVTSP
jgi:hypothetical protein